MEARLVSINERGPVAQCDALAALIYTLGRFEHVPSPQQLHAAIVRARAMANDGDALERHLMEMLRLAEGYFKPVDAVYFSAYLSVMIKINQRR